MINQPLYAPKHLSLLSSVRLTSPSPGVQQERQQRAPRPSQTHKHNHVNPTLFPTLLHCVCFFFFFKVVDWGPHCNKPLNMFRAPWPLSGLGRCLQLRCYWDPSSVITHKPFSTWLRKRPLGLHVNHPSRVVKVSFCLAIWTKWATVLLNIRWMQNKLAAFLFASRRRLFYIQGHVNEDRRAQTRFKSWFPLSFVNIYDLFKFFRVTFTNIFFYRSKKHRDILFSFKYNWVRRINIFNYCGKCISYFFDWLAWLVAKQPAK